MLRMGGGVGGRESQPRQALGLLFLATCLSLNRIGRRGVDVDMKISGKELEVEESARAKHGVNPELAEFDDAHEEILSPAVVNGSREYCGSRRTE